MRIEKFLFIVGVLGAIGMSDLIAMDPSKYQRLFKGHANQGGLNQQPAFYPSLMAFIPNFAGFTYNQQPRAIFPYQLQGNQPSPRNSWEPPVVHPKENKEKRSSSEEFVDASSLNPNNRAREKAQKRLNAHTLNCGRSVYKNQKQIERAKKSKRKIIDLDSELLAQQAKKKEAALAAVAFNSLTQVASLQQEVPMQRQEAPISLPEQDNHISNKKIYGFTTGQAQQVSSKEKVSPLPMKQGITNVIQHHEPPVSLGDLNQNDDEVHFNSIFRNKNRTFSKNRLKPNDDEVHFHSTSPNGKGAFSTPEKRRRIMSPAEFLGLSKK